MDPRATGREFRLSQSSKLASLFRPAMCRTTPTTSPNADRPARFIQSTLSTPAFFQKPVAQRLEVGLGLLLGTVTFAGVPGPILGAAGAAPPDLISGPHQHLVPIAEPDIPAPARDAHGGHPGLGRPVVHGTSSQ